MAELSQEAVEALAQVEREGREAAEERADDLRATLVKRNDRIIELERRCVSLRAKYEGEIKWLKGRGR